MSVESARGFLDRFGTDKTFRRAIEDAPNDARKQTIAKDAGFNFTKADLKVLNKEGLEQLGDDVALPQSSGTWVGVGTGTASGTVAAGAGVAAAVTAGASASAAV